MRQAQRVSISRGNRKLGGIMNVSLVPVECCPAGVPCANEGCYALKAYRLYPATRRAWNRNARIARTNPRSYFQQIEEAIAKSKPRYFRWHVAGDILNTNYLHRMCRIATKFPRTKFLAFTKAFNIVNAYEDKKRLPPNLVVVFSAWPRMSVDNRREHRIAWMQDGTESRVPPDSVRCLGHCETCAVCFSSPKSGPDVVFHEH